MNRLSISVIVETVTRDDYAPRQVADALQGSIEAIRRQTYPRELTEIIVVVDGMFDRRDAEEVLRRHPSVKLVDSPEHNYFAAKNAGARAASGLLVVLLDGDCEPAADWLEMLASRFEPGVDAIAGRTRYTGNSLGARTFSVPDFPMSSVMKPERRRDSTSTTSPSGARYCSHIRSTLVSAATAAVTCCITSSVPAARTSSMSRAQP
jgi:glycosyltransferase involved in cell wall biosynthesis